MGAKSGSRNSARHQRGPDLPIHTQNRETFQRNIPFPSGSEEDFVRHHAELYGAEENLVDGQHVGIPHFPRGSERAKVHGMCSPSNHRRDTTRDAYMQQYDMATAECQELSADQAAYYNHTSDSMLPRHHAALLPLARAREFPNFHNATHRERLLTTEYGYHDLADQQRHWKSADNAYRELEQVQTDHARHRKYRSYPADRDVVDCYNNTPVHHTRPHTRSRKQGLPPPGTYCDRLHTPPEEDDYGPDEGRYSRR